MIQAFWNVLLVAPDGSVEQVNIRPMRWAKAEELADVLSMGPRRPMVTLATQAVKK